jgi:hypothetical protein
MKILHLLRTRDTRPEPSLVTDEDRSLVIDDEDPQLILDAIFAAELVMTW